MDTPIIYVACLASYNAGTLHGKWIDANQDVDAIQEEVNQMLRASPYPNVVVEYEGKKVPSAEEWAIHDYEGFGPIKLSEYESFEKVAEIAAAIEEHGEAWLAYVDHVGTQYATVEDFRDRYRCEADTEQAFAEQFAEETGLLSGISSDITQYFDYESYARDLFMDGFTLVRYNGTGYVFSDN